MKFFFKLLVSTALASVTIIAILLLPSCNKLEGEEQMDVMYWGLAFQFVDSSGNFLFARNDDLPFDPDAAYYVNGLGDKKSIRNHVGIEYVGSQDSIVSFELITTLNELKIEKEMTENDEFMWLLYIDVNRSPDTVKFRNPYFSGVDYLMINSDTVYNRSNASDSFYRAFYPVY